MCAAAAVIYRGVPKITSQPRAFAVSTFTDINNVICSKIKGWVKTLAQANGSRQMLQLSATAESFIKSKDQQELIQHTAVVATKVQECAQEITTQIQECDQAIGILRGLTSKQDDIVSDCGLSVKVAEYVSYAIPSLLLTKACLEALQGWSAHRSRDLAQDLHPEQQSIFGSLSKMWSGVQVPSASVTYAQVHVDSSLETPIEPIPADMMSEAMRLVAQAEETPDVSTLSTEAPSIQSRLNAISLAIKNFSPKESKLLNRLLTTLCEVANSSHKNKKWNVTTSNREQLLKDANFIQDLEACDREKVGEIIAHLENCISMINYVKQNGSLDGLF